MKKNKNNMQVAFFALLYCTSFPIIMIAMDADMGLKHIFDESGKHPDQTTHDFDQKEAARRAQEVKKLQQAHESQEHDRLVENGKKNKNELIQGQSGFGDTSGKHLANAPEDWEIEWDSISIDSIKQDVVKQNPHLTTVQKSLLQRFIEFLKNLLGILDKEVVLDDKQDFDDWSDFLVEHNEQQNQVEQALKKQTEGWLGNKEDLKKFSKNMQSEILSPKEIADSINATFDALTHRYETDQNRQSLSFGKSKLTQEQIDKTLADYQNEYLSKVKQLFDITKLVCNEEVRSQIIQHLSDNVVKVYEQAQGMSESISWENNIKSRKAVFADWVKDVHPKVTEQQATDHSDEPKDNHQASFNDLNWGSE